MTDDEMKQAIADGIAAGLAAAVATAPVPTAAEQVAVIEAQADATVKIIEAEADAREQIIEAETEQTATIIEAAESESESPAGDPLDDNTEADVPPISQPAAPETDHWLFRPLGRKHRK